MTFTGSQIQYFMEERPMEFVTPLLSYGPSFFDMIFVEFLMTSMKKKKINL